MCRADTQILEQDVSTPRIVSAVNHVLELCSEADAFRLNVMLTWPLLIAGQFCLKETREKVSSLFDAFHSDYGEDLVVAVSRDTKFSASLAHHLSVSFWKNNGEV